MKIILLSIYFCLFLVSLSFAQFNSEVELPPVEKKPWVAAAEVFGLNVGVWAFDRYVLKEDWAYISIQSMKDNLKHGFEYDWNHFTTNYFLLKWSN